jgi:hypothetical protein
MKKSSLIFISSIVLFILINIAIAEAGCVTINVVYNDGCARSNADIKTIVAPSPPKERYVCTTGEDGTCTRCDYLEPGDYQIQAWYSASQFGFDIYLDVDENGDGSQTITDLSNYPNGTETCGDTECDGYQYCVGNPKYIECDSWDTECDTKKCCQCDGGSQANPTENYDIQNEDCGFCEECSALDICSYAIGTDPKEECPEDSCKYGYCDGSGACDMKPSTTDCGTCALCDGSGNCNVYDETQDEDCNPFDLPEISTCTWNPDNNPFTWDYHAAVESVCQALETCSQPTYSDYTHTCDMTQCGAECDATNPCADTNCDYLDGCVGDNYHDYYDVPNDCLADCTCENNACGSPTIYPNDPRCTECQTDDDCNVLDNDYCVGDLIRHDEGRCVDYSCQVETTTTYDCNNDNTDYCDGTEIKHDDYTCNNAACILDQTTILQDCDDTLYCNGQETCFNAACQVGIEIDCSDDLFCTVNEYCDENLDQCVHDDRDCSGNDITGIAMCTNDPDANPFTWDYRQAFTSVCDEINDVCTSGDQTINHTCDVTQCGAECETNEDCETEVCLDDCTCLIQENFTLTPNPEVYASLPVIADIMNQDAYNGRTAFIRVGPYRVLLGWCTIRGGTCSYTFNAPKYTYSPFTQMYYAYVDMNADWRLNSNEIIGEKDLTVLCKAGGQPCGVGETCCAGYYCSRGFCRFSGGGSGGGWAFRR